MHSGKCLLLVCLFVAPAFAGVSVSSPTYGSTSGSPVHFVASASAPGCSKGVAAMGIYTAPNVLAYKVNGSSLNTTLNMSAGQHSVVVQDWDNCGSSSKAAIAVNVGGSSSPSTGTTTPSGGKTFYNLQRSQWPGYALLPPNFPICTSCTANGTKAKWSWNTNQTAPSLDGMSTRTSYNGGTTLWADILWNNKLIGDFSTQGLPDKSKTLIPTLHNFTYDVWFYIANVNNSQALEFDINQFFGGKGYIWGHECRINGGHEWDTWSNPGNHWVPSGIPCNPVNGWNHLIINVQRTSNNQLLFKTITLNGKTATVNRLDSPCSRAGWYGVTINYQMDSNRYKVPYPVYLDKVTFHTW